MLLETFATHDCLPAEQIGMALRFVSSTSTLLQALAEKNAAIAESERCQRKLGLANRLIAALASEGDRWALTVQQLRKDYQVSSLTLHWMRRRVASRTHRSYC